MLYRLSENNLIKLGISETVFGEFPWMARLVRIDSAAGSNALFHCGASLLSRSIILTAAHCVK